MGREWEDSDSDIEYAIQDALDDYFMIRNYRRRKQTEEEVEELWSLVSEQKEPDTHYYKGSPVFPGMFAKGNHDFIVYWYPS